MSAGALLLEHALVFSKGDGMHLGDFSIGERVERLVERTNLESEGGLARFQSQLDRLGVNAALEAAGVKPGDAVRIAGVEFEYQP